MNFKHQVASGLKWNILDTVAVKGLGFLAILILTRLLSPEDFGVISIVTVFITIGTAIVDGGMGVSLIRDQEVDNDDFSTVFISNLGLGLVLYMVMFLLAPVVAQFYSRPEITLLIRVLGINFFIMSASVVQTNLLMKEMDFKRLTIAAIPGTIIGGGLGIAMALKGYGAWSLVAMQIGTQLIKTVMIWAISKWRFSLIFSKIKFRKHFQFGYRLVLSNVLSIIFTELYALLIGKRFSVATLGFYNRARTFTLFPVSMVGLVIGNVSYPMLSKLKDDPKAITKNYQKIIRSAFFLLGGIMVTLYVTSEPLFLWLFKDGWAPFIPYFRILCLSAALIPIHEINLNVFKVFDKTGLMLKIELVKKVLILMVFAIGFFGGMEVMLYAMVASSYLALLINSYYAGTIIQYATRLQLLHMLPTFITGILTAIIVTYIGQSLIDLLLIYQVIIIGFLSVSIFLLLNLLLKNRGMFELVGLGLIILKKR